VVTWDRRRDDGESGAAGAGNPPSDDDRRKQMAFTWEMADFVVVPGEASTDELPEPALRAIAPQGGRRD